MYPLKLKGEQIKVNWAITVLAVASLAIHISVGLRTYAYKYFANKADKQAMVTGLSVADNRTKQVNNQTLVSLTANILIIAAMHVLAVSTIYVNNREPDFIEQYPNYILVYVQNLCIYPLLFLIIAFVYYVKNPQLRVSFRREFKTEVFHINCAN